MKSIDPQCLSRREMLKLAGTLLSSLMLDGALLSSMVQVVQIVTREFGLDKTGFYVRANAAVPGVTSHMHWHVVGPGIP